MWKTLTGEHINYCFHHAFGGGVEPVTSHPPLDTALTCVLRKKIGGAKGRKGRPPDGPYVWIRHYQWAYGSAATQEDLDE